jgi:hypothetical protein
MEEFILYDNIFSSEDLDPYKKKCSKKFWNNSYRPDPSLRLGKRNTISLGKNYPEPSKIYSKYVEFLPEYVNSSLETYFENGFSIDAKLSKYDINDEYFWHSDALQKSNINSTWHRIFSSITYLNDDYEGGETEFLDLIIKPQTGKTVVFPSNYCFVHRGRPVLSGTKYILVMHFWV